MRLNLGSGPDYRLNYVNVDIDPKTPCDKLVDLTQPWPFESDSVDEILANDIIEHLPDKLHTLREMWRVCKPRARIRLQIPRADIGQGAYRDPTHTSFWVPQSFSSMYMQPGPWHPGGYHFRVLKFSTTDLIDEVSWIVVEMEAVKDYLPLVSVVVPLHNTPFDIFYRTVESVQTQSYNNWELILIDDSTSLSEETRQYINGLEGNIRVHYVRFNRHSGYVGQVKRRGFMLAEGDLLVELDHDDQLQPNCLKRLVDAHKMFPNAGLYYSDCAEFINGLANKYPPGWAFGFGTEIWDEENNRWHIQSPPINAATIRHIVSTPNHVRCWNGSVYRSLNGHDPSLPVADDYDMMVRTFIEADYVHIPEVLYHQYIQQDSAQRVQNANIHRLVPEIAEKYKHQIHKRVLELNGEDWMWENGNVRWDIPRPESIKNLAYTFNY